MNSEDDFCFQHLPNFKFSSLDNADVKESLGKWSMSDGLKLQAYSFDKSFRKYNEKEFVLAFFGSQNVVSTLLKATPTHTFIPIGIPADTVKFSEVKCTMTTLHVFDNLKKDNKIVRSNGAIVKCMPQYVSGGINGSEQAYEVEIADNLRKLIISNGDADSYDDFEDISDAISGTEKKEFLFSLFSHLVIGGSLCQYEDNIEPYIQAIKSLYKDLVAVAMAGTQDGAGDGDNCKFKVVSCVYKIHSAFPNDCAANENGNKDLLFHRQYLNNFFYLIVNPLKQLCFTVYHHV